MGRETERPQLAWEKLNSDGGGLGGLLNWDVYRAKVPGGWLVLTMHNTTGLTFYPDSVHKWDGGSLT